MVFGYLAQAGNWQAQFVVAAILLVIGAGIWAFWLDPERSVVERHAAPPVPLAAAAE